MYDPRKISVEWSSQERLDEKGMEDNRDKYRDLVGMLEGKKLFDRTNMDFTKL
jgi:hypothetical protein